MNEPVMHVYALLKLCKSRYNRSTKQMENAGLKGLTKTQKKNVESTLQKFMQSK